MDPNQEAYDTDDGGANIVFEDKFLQQLEGVVFLASQFFPVPGFLPHRANVRLVSRGSGCSRNRDNRCSTIMRAPGRRWTHHENRRCDVGGGLSDRGREVGYGRRGMIDSIDSSGTMTVASASGIKANKRVFICSLSQLSDALRALRRIGNHLPCGGWETSSMK